MKPLAVIFDLDGTVLDDENQYGLAFKKVLRDLGVIVKEKYPHKGGIGVRENWKYLLSKYNIKTDKNLQELCRATQKAFLEQLDTVRVREGFRNFVENLKQLGIAVTLATSNEWFIVEMVLDELDLGKYFESIVTGDEVRFKKPDPEIFIAAAQKLGFETSDCMVFEDSPAGITAAKEAGMKVVGISNEGRDKNELSHADYIIENYDEIYEKLGNFFN